MRSFWVIFFLVFIVADASAEPGYREVASGNAAFTKGDFKSATDHYVKAAEKNPSQAIIDYDLGTAYYKSADYAKAVEHLQKGLLTDDPRTLDRVHFNLANALYKAGVALEDKDIQAAITSVEQALPHYEKVLATDPKSQDADFNHGFVKKELERLKKKKQEQKNNKTCPNPKKGSSGQNKDQSQQDENEEQSSSQDQQAQKPEQPRDGQDQQKPSSQGQKEAAQEQSPEKEGDQKPQESPTPQADQAQAQSSEGQDKKDEASSSGQAPQPQISSQKEARMLLDDFDQNEQPKGLLNFIREKHGERAVEKDW